MFLTSNVMNPLQLLSRRETRKGSIRSQPRQKTELENLIREWELLLEKKSFFLKRKEVLLERKGILLERGGALLERRVLLGRCEGLDDMDIPKNSNVSGWF